MKEGDIVMVFGQPIKLTHPIGQARLVKKIKDQGSIELWHVEYTNDEGHTYEAFIKKDGKK